MKHKKKKNLWWNKVEKKMLHGQIYGGILKEFQISLSVAVLVAAKPSTFFCVSYFVFFVFCNKDLFTVGGNIQRHQLSKKANLNRPNKNIIQVEP